LGGRALEAELRSADWSVGAVRARAHVLALVTEAFGGGGGIAQYNRDFLRALSTLPAVGQIDVLPRLAKDAPSDMPERVAQYAPCRNKVAYAMRALLLALPRRPDIVFCGHLFMAPLGVLIARLARAKLVVQTHGIEVWDRPSASQRSAVEAAELILSVSRDTRGRVLTWASNPPERCVVLPNTVGDEFTPGDGSRTRDKLGLGSQKVLLSVSRLDARQRYKGQDRVIPLIRALRDRGHDVVYLIGGSGDDQPRLEQLAQANGVLEWVRFLGDVPDGELVDLYRAADVYLMPSSGEGFGIVFLEAMACGVPAIGLALGGANDALCDGELGGAARPEDLLGSIVAQLSAPRPEPEDLVSRVRSRFGRIAFESRVARVMETCL